MDSILPIREHPWILAGVTLLLVEVVCVVIVVIYRSGKRRSDARSFARYRINKGWWLWDWWNARNEIKRQVVDITEASEENSTSTVLSPRILMIKGKASTIMAEIVHAYADPHQKATADEVARLKELLRPVQTQFTERLKFAVDEPSLRVSLGELEGGLAEIGRRWDNLAQQLEDVATSLDLIVQHCRLRTDRYVGFLSRRKGERLTRPWERADFSPATELESDRKAAKDRANVIDKTIKKNRRKVLAVLSSRKA